MTPSEQREQRRASYLEKLQRASSENVGVGAYLNNSYSSYLFKELKRNQDFAKAIYDLTEITLKNLEEIKEPENRRSHSRIRTGWLNLNTRAREAYENTRQF